MNKNNLCLPVLLFLFSFFHCQIGNSQLVINEYSAANYDQVPDNFGEFEDWFELYNTAGANVDLSGYFLSDKISNPMKWELPAGISIPANGRLIFYASGGDQVIGTSYHTNFKLTQTKGNEYVVLADPTGQILDSIFISNNISSYQ